MAKKVDPLKAKQKRQKMIAAGGGVVLLALLAIQVPRVMKHLNQKPPSTPAAATAAAPVGAATPSTAPTVSGTAQTASATAAATGSAEGIAGDAAPVAQEGQLASFSRFASKDPFAQQLAENAGPGGGSEGSSASGSSAPTGAASAPTSGVPSAGGGGSQPAPGGAVISVNGTLMTVTVGTDFPPAGADPAAQPMFHLVSVRAHSAKISIVGGSYANGSATVTLRENKPLTLMNTADGTRYKLILKPQGTAVPTTPATASTPTSATTGP